MTDRRRIQGDCVQGLGYRVTSLCISGFLDLGVWSKSIGFLFSLFYSCVFGLKDNIFRITDLGFRVQGPRVSVWCFQGKGLQD